MRGVWGISSGRVHVESSDDSTWKIVGATTPVDPPDRKRGQDVQDVLLDKGGNVAMYRGGVPGFPSNKDGNAGSIIVLTRPSLCGDDEGGKPPPPTVSVV